MAGYFRRASTAQDSGPQGTKRRTILSTVGVGGLGVLASVMGASRASAQPNLCAYNCCTLANCPNTTYAYCSANASYIWDCQTSGSGLHCACCETAGNQFSAAYCSYG